MAGERAPDGGPAPARVQFAVSHYMPRDHGTHRDFIAPWARAVEAGSGGRLRVTAHDGDSPLGRLEQQHAQVVFSFVMNRARYDGLLPALLGAIDAASGPALAARFGGWWESWAAPAREAVARRGNTVSTLPDGERARWTRAAQPVQRWLTALECSPSARGPRRCQSRGARPRHSGGSGPGPVNLLADKEIELARGSSRPSAPSGGDFPIAPPIEPMLAKLADALPPAGPFLYEPKWDGFRAIVFRGASELFIQSRELRPLDRYFPELHEALLERLPRDCVVDGEIVIRTPEGLDFDALQLRLHPAASRVAKLARELPSSFVAFDLLAAGGRSLMNAPQAERRSELERLLAAARAPLHLTPMTRDRATAVRWLAEFEGAGLDGVIAKPADSPYQPGKRAMLKVKHARTAECVVAGFRWHKSGRDAVGSLLLGLYDDRGALQHVGITSAFTTATRRQLAVELEPLRAHALDEHPWREWAQPEAADSQRMPGGHSRWSQGKDLSWEPVRIERVCEVKYDHLQGDRFRHATIFLRWRPDKSPRECRYDQLEVTPPYELDQVFSSGSSGS